MVIAAIVIVAVLVIGMMGWKFLGPGSRDSGSNPYANGHMPPGSAGGPPGMPGSGGPGSPGSGGPGSGGPGSGGPGSGGPGSGGPGSGGSGG